MAENIKLAEFDIDADGIVQAAQDIKRSIDEIKKAQADARKDGDTASKTYVENEARLSSLNKEYRQHINVLRDNIAATTETAARGELITAALSEEITTIKEARAQNKILNDLRNSANTTTEEGREEILRLNQALDENNAFIKENVDGLSQQRMNVGNYEDSIKSALSEMNPFNQSIGDFKNKVDEAGGALPFFQKGLRGVYAGIVSVTKASLAFLSTPIGAVLGVIGLALGIIVNALSTTQEGMDRMTAVTRPLTAVLEVLKGIVQDVGLALINAFSNPMDTLKSIYNYIKGQTMVQLEALGNIVAGIFTLDWDRFNKGVDQWADNAKKQFESVANAAKGVNDRIQEGVRLGQELDRLTKEYEQTQIRNAELLPQLNAQLREQNKIAEDQTKSTAEREVAARATVAISEQINARKREELQLELAIAENQASRNDTSREDELEIARIKGQIYDADAQATEQQTTQQNKLNTIRKDAINQQQKAVDAQISKQRELLDLFLAEQGVKARTLAEDIVLEETTSQRRRDILDAELAAKKISQEAYQTAILNLEANLGKRRAELAVENAMREVDANRMALELRRENEQFLSQELAEQRKQENAVILSQQQELAQMRLQNGLINQQEFDDAIRELTEANRISNLEIDREREAIDREERAELRAIEFQEELARLQQDGATKFELQQAQLAEQRQVDLQRLEEQRSKGAISEELYQARLNKINADFDRARSQSQLENERILAEQRINIADQMFGAIANIVDKNSAFGKALAISQALINTYKGITSALAAPFPASIPAVAAAATTGFAAVKDILSTKVPKAEGGNISSGGGMRGSVSSDLSSLQSNQSNLSQVAASGNATVQGQIETGAAQAGLSESVSNAVRDGAREGTQTGSEQGLTNLSNNRNIREASTF